MIRSYKEKNILPHLFLTLRNSLLIFISILFIGVAGYRLILGDQHSLFEYLYMTVITVSTVGYGEILGIDSNPAARIFTMFMIVIGMSGLMYVVSNVTTFFVEGELLEIFRRRRMEKEISEMKGHYIVCGAGRLGRHIVYELIETERKIVIVDTRDLDVEGRLDGLTGLPIIHGDATEDEILKAAGIERAAGIFAATGHDKDNMVIVMTARQINQEVRVIARCNELRNMDKLKKAGADSVVSANHIGGLRMASEMVRPTVVSFLDIMLRDREKNLRVEEIEIPANSRLDGTTVRGAALGHEADILLLAVKNRDGSWIYNPRDDMVLRDGMSLIIMGTPKEKERLEKYLKGR